MNIFGGRPGFAAGITAIIAVLAVSFFEFSVSVALFITSISIVIICAVLCICKYITPYRLIANIIIAAVFIAALIRGGGIFFGSMLEANELCGEEKSIHATVIQRGISNDYFTEYTLRLHSVDGKECNLKAVLNCNYNSDLQKGYEFVLRNAEVKNFEGLERSDKLSMISQGVYLLIETSNPNDYAVLSEGNHSFFDYLNSLNSYLSAKLRNDIKGEEGDLAAAMLLGDKYALSSSVRRDFSRAGLSHYLAVSGLHVSIITGIVSFLLMRLRIRKFYRNILMTFFAVAYLFLLGFPVSAVRSVTMLLIVFLAYSMGDNADPLNSLGISAAFIVLVNPTSVFDYSFILSFTATLGIVCFMPMFNGIFNKLFKNSKTSFLKKPLSFFLGTLMSTAAALSLTLLPVSYMFGEISVVGFVSNLAAAFLGMPFLASTLLYLVIGNVPYIGEGLSGLIRFFGGAFTELASDLGDIRGAVLPLVSDGAIHMILTFSILIYILLIIKIKKKDLLLLLPAFYPFIILSLIFTATASRPKTPELTIESSSGNDIVLVACNDSVAIIDMSEGSAKSLIQMSRTAHEDGYTEIDMLVLTHYHNDHIASVSRYVQSQKVRRILLPYPENEADAWIMLQITEMVRAEGCHAEMIPRGKTLMLPGDIEFTLPELIRLERSNHPVFYCSLTKGDEQLTYIGESSWEAWGEEIEKITGQSRVVIFGLQGPVSKSFAQISYSGDAEYLFLADYPIEDVITPEDLIHIENNAVFNVSEWKYIFSD